MIVLYSYYHSYKGALNASYVKRKSITDMYQNSLVQVKQDQQENVYLKVQLRAHQILTLHIWMSQLIDLSIYSFYFGTRTDHWHFDQSSKSVVSC